MVLVKNYTTAEVEGLPTTGGNLVYDSERNMLVFRDGTGTSELLFNSSTDKSGVNTTNPDVAFEINSAAGNNLRLTYNDADGSAVNYADFAMSATGDMTIDTSGNDVIIAATDNLNISGHDGSTLGLQLGGTLVTSTAAELNYVDVAAAGTAEASKAIVLDGNKDITGINSITANSIISSSPITTLATGSVLVNSYNNEDMQGRMIKTDSITTINLTDYDPTGQSDAYGLEVVGYIKPLYTETYTFYVSSNDNVRVWVNNTNIYQSWQGQDITDQATSTIALTANEWYPLIIHNADISGTHTLALKWQSASQANEIVPSSAFAWDGSDPNVRVQEMQVADIMRLYSTGSVGAIETSMFVSSTGDLTIENANASKKIDLDSAFVDVSTHDGSSAGLQLGGVLVTATAAQLNYTEVTTAGTAEASKALVVDGSLDLAGINNVTSTGTLGVNTSAPDKQAEINSATGDCLRLTYNDSDGTATNYADFDVGSSGDLTITASGSDIFMPSDVIIGGTSAIQNFGACTISHPAGSCLTLVYNDTETIAATFQMASDGDLILDVGANKEIRMTSQSDFNINSHDGSSYGLKLGNTLVTATAAEINLLDGLTSSTAELNILDGVTATTAELNILDGVTATFAELNYVDVTTAGTAEASKALVLDGNLDITGINELTATTINATNLAVSGVISNLNTGEILVRSYSEANMEGRMILKESVSTIDLTDYDPDGQTDGYSLEVIGYIKPLYTETYTFYISSNDKVRMYINNNHSYTKWADTTTVDQASDPVALTANKWYPIYIQHIETTGSQNLTVKWQSTSQANEIIPSSALAWDDRTPSIFSGKVEVADEFKLYHSNAGNQAVKFTTSTAGNLTIAPQGGNVTFANSAGSVDIATHDGSTKGLELAGVLVTSSATQLNYTNISSPGLVEASKTIVTDGSKNIRNLGAVGIGTNNNADSQLEINDTTGECVRLTYNDADGSAVNYTDLHVSSGGDFLVLPSSGAVGINTSAPDKAFEINSATGANLRLTYNDSDGTAANYSDFSMSASGDLTIAPSGTDTFFTGDIIVGDGTAVGTGAITSSAADGYVLSFLYNDNVTLYADFQMAADGDLIIDVGTDKEIRLTSASNFNINSHDGATYGLKLGNTLVTATANEINLLDGVTATTAELNILDGVTATSAELNYLDITTLGTAEASKALVVDGSLDIVGINTIGSTIINSTDANFTVDSATGNTTLFPLNIARTTSDTPATNLGVGIEFDIENSTNVTTTFGSLEVTAATITDAAEDGKFTFRLISGGTDDVEVATLASDGTFSCDNLVETSDRRVKENIVNADLEESYNKIMDIRVVDYNFIYDDHKLVHRGVIAQELKEVIPNAVSNIGEKNGIADFNAVSNRELVGFLVGTIQHMDKIIKQQDVRLQLLEQWN